MPSDRFIKRFKKENSTAELLEHQGDFLIYGSGKASKSWIDIVERRGMPKLGSEVIVLTGEANRNLNSLGCCIYGAEGRQRVEVLFLDNPDREAMKDVDLGILRFHLPRLFTREFVRKAWTAYLAKVYLHELGHARYFHKNGSKRSESRQEQEAEKFAWSWMSKLFDKEMVLAAYSMFWMLACVDDSKS